MLMFESETPGLVVYSGLISICENRNYILCMDCQFWIVQKYVLVVGIGSIFMIDHRKL